MESLRLIDTVESYQPRCVPEGGCSIEGYFLPEGTIVSSHPALMHAHPHVFPQPERFDPERWLVDKERYKKLQSAFWAFSSGPRACSGRHLAASIIKNVIFEIYLNFSTSLSESNKNMHELFEVHFRNRIGTSQAHAHASCS